MKCTKKSERSWSRLLFFVLLLAALGSSQAAQKALERTQSIENAQSKAVERSKYEINLKLNFDLRSYAGSERVRWINRGERSTSALYFHLYSNLRVAQPTPARVPTLRHLSWQKLMNLELKLRRCVRLLTTNS